MNEQPCPQRARRNIERFVELVGVEGIQIRPVHEDPVFRALALPVYWPTFCLRRRGRDVYVSVPAGFELDDRRLNGSVFCAARIYHHRHSYGYTSCSWQDKRYDIIFTRNDRNYRLEAMIEDVRAHLSGDFDGEMP
jgi:hypothetical protein